MSYILEALKKSDQQRQQGATPTLNSVQLPVEENHRQPFPWLIALAVIVFIAGILIGWLQPWNSGQSAATVSPIAVKTPEASPPSMPRAPMNVPTDATATLARNPGQVPSPQTSPVMPLPAAASPAPVQSSPMPAARLAPPVVRNDSPAPAARTPVAPLREPVPTAPAKSAGAAEQNVIAKAELPPAILQELPSMSVALHAYSNKPSNRLVSINDKLLQEGDSLVPGLILEEVTRKDMIFTYKGFRFRQSVQ
jgi:general secretion pathway protein B